MNAKFSNHPGTILREDRLGLFTQSSFLPVHFHWTTTTSLSAGREANKAKLFLHLPDRIHEVIMRIKQMLHDSVPTLFSQLFNF